VKLERENDPAREDFSISVFSLRLKRPFERDSDKDFFR